MGGGESATSAGTFRPVLKSITRTRSVPDAQPIHRAGNDPAIGQGRGDRRFGQRIRAEQAGKRRVADQASRPSPAISLARHS